MFPSLPFLLCVVLLLKLDFVMLLDLLLSSNAFIEINRIYIHCINMIYFFIVLVWVLLQVVDGSISSTSADLCEVVDLSVLCALPFTGQASSGQMAGSTISATLFCRHFSMCLWFVSVPLLLFLLHQHPMFHLDWWLSWNGIFGFPVFLHRLILAHVLHLNLLLLWWVLYFH